MMKHLFAIALALALAATTAPAGAGSTGDWLAAQARIDGQVRHAMFYARTGNVAGLAVAYPSAEDGWRMLAARYAAARPDVFAEDARWQADLDAVTARFSRARQAFEREDWQAMRAALAEARNLWRAQRRRNRLWIFADCVAEMRAGVAKLSRYRAAPPDPADAMAMGQVRETVLITRHWYHRCRAEAPEAYRGLADFKRLFDDAIELLDFAAQAVASADVARLIRNIRGLRSYDGLIWLRFG